MKNNEAFILPGSQYRLQNKNKCKITESTCDTTTDKKFLKYFHFLEINYENNG